IPETIDAFFETIRFNIENAGCKKIKRSWELLAFHGELCKLLAKALAYKASGKKEEATAIFDDFASLARINEGEVNDVLDVYLAVSTLRNVIKSDEATEF
ncbi:MAG: hypothetical protein LBC62_08585, partial [Treponema sp.]|nr:hypothetical protein [Treponema sp.]